MNYSYQNIYKIPCHVLFPSICITRYQKTNEINFNHELLKKNICKEFTYYMNDFNEFNLNGLSFSFDDLKNNLLDNNIIFNFTINLKTPIHVEFKTIVCNDNDIDKDTDYDREQSQFTYEMTFLNINIDKKFNIFEEAKKNVIDKGDKAIAIIYDDIDDNKSLLFNNLMATYQKIKNVIINSNLCNNLIENIKYSWEACIMVNYSVYINNIYKEDNERQNCFLKLNNTIQETLLEFRYVNLEIIYPDRIKRIINIIMNNNYFLEETKKNYLYFFNKLLKI